MRSFLARVLGVRLDEVDAVVKNERPEVERVLSRRGFLAAAAALAASPVLPEPEQLVQVATWEQTVTYSIPKLPKGISSSFRLPGMWLDINLTVVGAAVGYIYGRAP